MLGNDHDAAHKCANGRRVSDFRVSSLKRWDHVSHQSSDGIPSQTPLTRVCVSSSEVILSNVDVGISGIWECVASSSRGNASQRMEIVVLETSATYCQMDRVTTNKGDFR